MRDGVARSVTSKQSAELAEDLLYLPTSAFCFMQYVSRFGHTTLLWCTLYITALCVEGGCFTDGGDVVFVMQ